MVDQHPILVVVLELEAVVEVIGDDDVEVVTLRDDGHLSLIVLGDVDLLHQRDVVPVAYHVVAGVGLDLLAAVGADADRGALDRYAQDGMDGIDLLVALDITLDGGGGCLDEALEELIHAVLRAARQQQCPEGEERSVECLIHI